MKTRNYFNIVFLVLFIFSMSYSVLGDVPQQFYGEVITNGNPAPDNLLVIVKIGETDVASTVTNDGNYGLIPNLFYVPDPNGNREGKTLNFFIVDTVGTEFLAGEYTFSNGKSTELTLVADGLNLGSTDGGGGNDGGGSGGDGGGGSSSGGGGGSSSASCTPNWQCSDWLDCVNTIQKRVCTDSNNCHTEEGKPEEQRECISEELKEAEEQERIQNLNPIQRFLNLITGSVVTEEGDLKGSGIALISIIVVIIIGIIVFQKRKKSSDDEVPSTEEQPPINP